jgi:DNA-binding XRE family transcriptional regulator
MNSISKLGKQLKAERKRRLITQAEVANALGCSTTIIGRAERGDIQKYSKEGFEYLQNGLISRLKQLPEDYKYNSSIKIKFGRNTERNIAIYELAKTGTSLVEIAKIYGLSRQRIQQIVGKPQVYPEQVCPYCDTIFTPKQRGVIYCSSNCWNGSQLGWTPKHKWAKKRLHEITSQILPPNKQGCWFWNGNINRVTGYGKIIWESKEHGAHRWMWEMVIGTIPDGMCILHKCDNPRCVNPAHLFLGNTLDNMKDRDNKGRQKKPHRFDVSQIRTIRTFYKDTKDVGWLSRAYGVHSKSIYNIVKRLTYANVSD